MVDEKIKISVIIPIYNENKKYLEECVSSICGQTYNNLEIILVDDGSSAPCYEMCDTYIDRDKRVRVFHKENGGSQSARKKGIEEATGDYVAFVDSDDWLELDLYKKMAEVIIRDQPDMLVASNYYRNYVDGRTLIATDNRREGFWKNNEFEEKVFPYFIKTEDYFDTDFPTAMWLYLFKTDLAHAVMQKIDSDIKIAEDYTFLMIALLNARSFASISYRGYHYRSNVNSKTHTITNIKELIRPVYEKVNFEISRSEYDKEILRVKNRIFIFHSLMLREYKDLLDQERDFLFPYPTITKGSKVLIYGMGKLGGQIYYAIKDNTDYVVSGVADKDWKAYRKKEMNVISPEEIIKKDFDHLIIAITYVNVRRQIKNDLLKAGVPEYKFARIDMNLFDEQHLPF